MLLPYAFIFTATIWRVEKQWTLADKNSYFCYISRSNGAMFKIWNLEEKWSKSANLGKTTEQGLNSKNFKLSRTHC